ncbi:rRNA biogenesis protein RRP5-like isoform X2 [Salvia splendens]|uniref:rRNA biogenesis protein RRP5-like isoform X2 n=1 Tax=Salvia splendens TaxID=180675 RepID=UPI001C25BB28|nr:rRNA biogenesis protein RRP5-like isoform X2 [Salvia splendens]
MAPPAKKFNSKPSSERPCGRPIASSQLPLQLEDDAPDFPRGGGTLLSREERNEAREGVEKDFETEIRVLKKRKKEKRVQHKDNSTEDDLGLLFGDGITGKLPRFANKITLKNVSSGMKLWGVIAEVNEKDIIVSLPGGLRGLVRACDAFDPISSDEVNGDVDNSFLSRIYQKGQLVSCVVLQVDDDKKELAKRKIWLSLRLSVLHKSLNLDSIQEGMVLSAYVKSIEDHGFMLHFGLPAFAGFMPKKNQSGIGQLLQGIVKSVDRSRKVVHMSSDMDVVSKYVTKELKGISIDLLVPGMMVNARVQSTLENGILLSFLTYFTGTVDIFNLDKTFPSSKWKNDYAKNIKFNARILFIDPSTRAVGLTLSPQLVSNKASTSLVKVGDIFEQCKVVRVDKGSGLLLEVPTEPFPTPAYVNVNDVADKEVKLDKIFKEGSSARARILGYRHLEGLATATLKTSAFEGSVFTHSDVKPGMVVKAKVIAIDSFGAIVQLASGVKALCLGFSGVKALCPLRHMSEFEITKPRKKFEVGTELVFRVLGCKSKRITVTHKKTLVKSKLEILSSYADGSDGLVTHGWITKIEKHGCFVRFYNGVQGFAPRSELGLGPGSDIHSMYHVEQVVKCRVVKCLPASHRINLSFNITPTRGSEGELIKPGSLVSGVVESVATKTIVVAVHESSRMKGTIVLEHLADHHGLATLLISVMKPGYHFDKLLVLDVEGNNLILTAKNSLVNSIEQLPAEISQISCHSVVHGYICNIIDAGCFVRFMGRLTGFAPKSKVTDDRRSDLSEVFFVGQSVRSNIVDISSDTGRITLSLKQSLCSSTDASFIQEYFLLEEKISELQVSDSQGLPLKWTNGFCISSVIEGKVHEIKDFGVVISFQEYSDVFGFISHYHLAETTLEKHSVVRAAVLDVSRVERLVDLSLKPELINKTKEESSASKTLKKKRKRESHKELEDNQVVNAIVEIVKENYLVLSFPAYNYSIGYASLTDYNTQRFPTTQFSHGQSVTATVMALPGPTTGGRLLLLLKSLSDGMETSSSKRAKKSSYDVGSLVQAEISETKPLELRVKFGSGFNGRIHITEATDDNSDESPFSEYRVGQKLTARIVSKGNRTESSRGYHGWDLSVKPSLLKGDTEMSKSLSSEDINYSYGQRVYGFVYKIDPEWAWLTVSREFMAQLYILDSSSEPCELVDFQKRFYVGKAVSGFVINVNKEKKLLRVALRAPPASGKLKEADSDRHSLCQLVQGSVVGGRISKILPGVGGLLVQIDQHHYGKVHFTELTDAWVSNPLSGYQEGQFVKCRVLEINHAFKGSVHVDLSLRSAQDASGHTSTRRVDTITDFHPDMAVHGYVKNVSKKGCFIMLSRNIDARILISNLSDDFIENPEKDFSIGQLVTGKVLSVEPLSKRAEVTLRTSSAVDAPKSNANHLNQIMVGDIINGKVKRVESYGLFISIDQTNVVGLCHVSELSDDHVDDLPAKFKAGEIVTAKVLKVDKERNRVSLGMKNSYIAGEGGSTTPSRQSIDVTVGMNGSVTTSEPSLSQSSSEDMENGSDADHIPLLADAESRALVPPLEVQLDDIESLDIQGDISESVVDVTDGNEEKTDKKTKKRAREEREREIRAAEERLLEKDIPRSAEEFEKLIRSSPNSSFIWIKYMAFKLSLADIEKARSIAERALRTINIREESEKLNIWVAYFNLENEYGNPPEEAVQKIFERALQYCDPKKVNLALLGMYERTEQLKLADDLLNKMSRKFKHSCKVWLRKIQSLVKKNGDGVQSVVERGLKSLPRHKHIKFITQTAILEFKCGVPDRGRSLFEKMLREYPKRTDLWSVYLDQEIRVGDTDLIRALFERAISLSLPPKKMKFLFNKYLQYEKSTGDEQYVESVKAKAMEYVATLD